MSNDILTKTLAEIDPSTNEEWGEELTVNPTNIGFLMNNLSRLYQDSDYGAWRETLDNAADSHIGRAENADDYIEVTYPTDRQDNLMSYQDYGVGLCREQIVNNFLQFGNTTKKDLTTESGQYGYGSKSPLAAADWFTVYAVQDGLRNSFTVRKDPLDQNAAPRFDWDEDCKEGPVATDEPNGVRVSYPTVLTHKYNYEVRAWRYECWQPNALQMLGLPFDRIKFNGEPHLKTVHNETLFQEVTGSGAPLGWFDKGSFESTVDTDEAYVKLGNVIYLIREDVVENSAALTALKEWKRLAVIHSDINLIEVVPSRDDLRYSPETVSMLDRLAAEMVEVMTRQEQLKLNRINTRREALAHYAALAQQRHPSTSALSYRDHGNLTEVVATLADLNPSNGFRGVLQGTARYVDGRRSRIEWSSMSALNSFRILSNASALGTFHIGSVEAEKDTRAAFAKVFKNRELIKRFGPDGDPTYQVADGVETVTLVTTLSRIEEVGTDEDGEMTLERREYTPDFEWWDEMFTSSADLEDSLIDARLAMREYNRDNNIEAPARAARRAGGTRAMFTVLTSRPDGTYHLEPHANMNDLAAQGEFYLVANVEAFDYSVMAFEETARTGALSYLPAMVTLLLEKATEEGRTVVVRTPRQVALPNHGGLPWSVTELQDYALEKLQASNDYPTFTAEELASFVLSGQAGHSSAHAHTARAGREWVGSADSLQRRVETVNEALDMLPAEDVEAIFPQELRDIVHFDAEKKRQIEARLAEYADQDAAIRRSRYVTIFSWNTHRLNEAFFANVYAETGQLLTEAEEKLKKYDVLIAAAQSLKGGTETLGEERYRVNLAQVTQLARLVSDAATSE